MTQAKPNGRRRSRGAKLTIALEQLLLAAYGCGWADAFDSERPPIASAEALELIEQAALEWQSRMIGRREERTPPTWLAEQIAAAQPVEG